MKKALIVLGVILLVLAIAPLLLPGTMHAEQTMEINAPAEEVYEQVVELKNWQNWSPWGLDDPTMKVKYGSQTRGKGGSYSWVGDPSKSGTGAMSITEAVQNKKIKTSLAFEGQGNAEGTWIFKENNGKTTVTWAFDSELKGYGKIARLFLPKMLEGQFRLGLEKIKEITER